MSERPSLQVLPGGGPAGARALAPLSDEALLALIATPEGDLALAELYDRYGRVAYGLAYRVLQSSSLAEDAVQEAFLAVWRTSGTYIRERGKPSTWLLTLVHRRAVDIVRREQRRREPLVEAVAPVATAADDEATLRDRRRAVGGRADGNACRSRLRQGRVGSLDADRRGLPGQVLICEHQISAQTECRAGKQRHAPICSRERTAQ